MKKEDLKELNELLKHRDPKEEAYEKVPAWKEQYYYELMDYSHVHTLDEFKSIPRGRIIKVINIQDEKLKAGGLVIDIKQNKKKQWYALVGIPCRNYIWKIYFHQNYVFLKANLKNESSEAFKDSISKFVTQEEKEKYTEKNYAVENLYFKYVLNKK
jgi:hypothetical protein